MTADPFREALRRCDRERAQAEEIARLRHPARRVWSAACWVALGVVWGLAL